MKSKIKKLNVVLIFITFFTSLLILSVYSKTDLNYSTYEAEHCVIKYMDGVSLETAKAAADAYEIAYVEVGKDLGEYYPKKLEIYLYKNQSTLVEGMILYSKLDPKWAHFFDRGGSIRPYKNKLHVNMNEILLKYISHEYTHTVIQEIYDTTYLKIKWLDEGLAEYESYKITYNPDLRKTPVWMVVKTNLSVGNFIPLEKLITENNWVNYMKKGNWCYKQSAAVVFYIFEIYGKEKVNEIFENLLMGKTHKRAVESALGKEISEFENEFIEYVKNN